MTTAQEASGLLAAPISFSNLLGEIEELVEAKKALLTAARDAGIRVDLFALHRDGQGLGVVEALEREVADFLEECGDVEFFALLFAHRFVGRFVTLRLTPLARRSADKFERRLDVWKAIFAEADVPFDIRALRGGSNYAKQHKIDAALALGRELAKE